MKKFKINLYALICCDYCNEIYGYRMDCPVCLTKYVDTNQPYAFYEDELPFEIRCNECRSEFKMENGDPYDDEWEWIR